MADEHIIQLLDVSKRFGDHIALHDINLTIKNGEFLTLVGPSGCGKTTLLRLLSGFDTPDRGKVILNGHDVTTTPPERRHVNMVFQSYALFPHMTVFENVAFGLRCQKVAPAQIRGRVEKALETVKLDQYASRKPAQLSGGQQQRVALARAVVNEPLVLLLDEPLSALDYKLRKSMQIELKQLQRRLGITFVFVTHDQEEALSMSDRVAVLEDGHIEQIGTPRDVYEEPCSLSVAKFIGETNIFETKVLSTINEKGEKDEKDEKIEVEIAGRRFTLDNEKGFVEGQWVNVILRPEDIRVWDHSEVDDTSEMLPGVVEQVIYKGSTVDLQVRLDSGQRIAASEFFDEDDEKLEYEQGEKIWVQWMAGWEVVLPHDD